MSNSYSLLYFWRYENYQLNFFLKEFFQSKESCFNFAADIRGLLLKISEQKYPDPKTICWEISYESIEEFTNKSPYFTLLWRRKENVLDSSKFILLDGLNYSKKGGKAFKNKLERICCSAKNRYIF